MNEIVNNFVLAGDTFMPEMHLRQRRSTYISLGHLQRTKERIQKFKETGDSRYIYLNKLDKACFQHGMAYGDFKDLTRRTASDNILRNKAFNFAKNPKNDGYERGLASMVHKFSDKKTSATHTNKFCGSGIKNKNISNKELAEELRKPIIRKFKKRKLHLSSIDNIWAADFDDMQFLADMQLLSKFNKEIPFFIMCY